MKTPRRTIAGAATSPCRDRVAPSRRSAKVLVVIIATLALFQLGCHTVRRGEPIRGEMKISDANVAHGKKLFMQHCYQCHPNGEGGLGPPINNKPAPGFLVKMQIRKGLGTMPSFTEEEISSEELDHLTEYVLALRRQDDRSAHR